MMSRFAKANSNKKKTTGAEEGKYEPRQTLHITSHLISL
jgi:hypothetical protein